ncbi:MAG: hypothetical protein N3B18_11150 [Desulfobacterota bacterium]|nr:hypothetical protein [Thermodesulfobacteriota bacterium]
MKAFSSQQSGFSMRLMSFEEMKQRYESGEDSLELVLEKWERIFHNAKTVFHLQHFQDILKAAVVPIFLCAEYANQCRICPIFRVCRQGTSEDWVNLMRVLQAYAIAGDLLPRDTLLGHIETFVNKLKSCREETFRTSN